jgi:mono/diheme cytochrome c family protein
MPHSKVPTNFQSMRLNRILVSTFVALCCVAGNLSGAPVEANPKTIAFFKEHCLRCHGPDEAKGDLRLDQLDADLSKPGNFERWRNILDRVESGVMPPKKEPRPPKEQVADVTITLGAELDGAAAKLRSDGRVVLRRLNRVEYENTVRDLFAVKVAVMDTLPEDAISQGFDNVGAALNISPVQMERYLETADAVVTAALAPVHNLKSTTQRFNLEMPQYITSWKQDDGIILFRTKENHGGHDLRAYKAPAPGRYRFRVTASAHNSEKPLTMVVSLGNFVVKAVSVNRQLGYYDVPPGKPSVLEFEERLEAKNDTIQVVPTGLPSVYLSQKTMPEYPGPGLKIHWIEIEGPFPETWPTESYRRVYGEVDPKTGKLADAENLIRALLPRAFRRPVREGEEKPFITLVAKSLEAGQPFEASLRAGYKAVLSSPKFLYLRESVGPLDDYAIASRLSYFLWSTMPDETLLASAAKGELRKPSVFRAQVERMLNHPKAKAFTENFTGQWLGLRDIAANTPDPVLYPEFEENLQWSSVRETHLFFEEMLKLDLGVKNFVDSDFTMLNGRLAKHYGIPDVEGVAFRKVALKPEYHRGGVLTHASVLKVTANGTTTSPVVRGVWVLDRILGRPAPPPPPNVPAIEPDIRGAKTIREQLAKHRATENCAGCHSRIDPPGFALENYDVIGGWRDRYRFVAEQKDRVNNRTGPLGKYLVGLRYGVGLPVDASDAMPDGSKFADIVEFKKLLLANPEQVARCVTEKLVTYATGQPVGLGDHAALKRILTETKPKDYGLRSLVHAIVASDLFLQK